jgi:hypothetical protein
MKQNTNYLNSTLVIAGLLFIGCETGVKQNRTTAIVEEVAPSGIVDKPTHQIVTTLKGTKVALRKIFSKSAQPGYYLQVGFFKHYKANSLFTKQLDQSGLNYTVLQKNGHFYALIGAYKSYNEAKAETSNINTKLNKKAFVVQVLRP